VNCGLGTFTVALWPTSCWRPYNDSSPFNRRIPANPRVVSNSQAMVNRILGMGKIAPIAVHGDTIYDWSHPFYFSRSSDPTYTIRCAPPGNWGTCPVEGHQVRIPSAARPAGGDDGHLAVIDQATGWEYTMWQVQDKPATGGTIRVSWAGRTSITGSGLGAHGTAAHFGLLAGVIKAADMEAGHIPHALFMVTGCTHRSFVYPAAGRARDCVDQTNAPPVGSYVQLNMTTAEINALAVPAWKKTVLRALAEHGAFIGDTGGNEAFSLLFESGTSYTSFGHPDPMVTFAKKQTSGVSVWKGGYYFDMASGVDWASRLRVLDPCVAAGTC
jgi:hypothetical protein